MAGPQTSPNLYPDQYTLQPNVEFVFTSDENWSHVEDMALRRRIQNKAAQRRYRRKMRDQQAASTAGHRSPIPLAMELSPNLPWYPDSVQGPNPIATGEHTPALSWDSETDPFLNGMPNKSWQCHPSEELLFPPSDTSFLEQTGRSFHGALPIDDPFIAVGMSERNCQIQMRTG
ncbi:uncharacterized protein EURHEDRAFT_294601 [Aspergillus ruber CBS 135680]|uniref:BZIP domain-containing protein n=1 Tax=Aspergillus ruber (strain CBS 135680) TaxID=1388766 RepID=A0A017SKG9_ASPRC|nr:uncharacterized protein EURHEDRAFT_294601 [Aspergillus ruber CBS 135680]EYE97453.1 hypothetical protein EURHEDRAFT_294601 [Aspergillus ruber CBS 135680]